MINIPDISLAEKILECASPSKSGESKFERSKFTILPSKYVNANGIDECRANIECKACNFIDVGDHKLIIADILSCQYDTNAYNQDLNPNYNTFTPVIYFGKTNLEHSQAHSFLNSIDLYNIEI